MFHNNAPIFLDTNTAALNLWLKLQACFLEARSRMSVTRKVTSSEIKLMRCDKFLGQSCDGRDALKLSWKTVHLAFVGTSNFSRSDLWPQTALDGVAPD